MSWEASSKVGSLDNVKHVAGGGKIQVRTQHVCVMSRTCVYCIFQHPFHYLFAVTCMLLLFWPCPFVVYVTLNMFLTSKEMIVLLELNTLVEKPFYWLDAGLVISLTVMRIPLSISYFFHTVIYFSMSI